MKIQYRLGFLVSIVLTLSACGRRDIGEFPITEGPPSLTLKFDGEINKNTVLKTIPMGYRGSDGAEDQTYTAILFAKNPIDAFYALADGIVVERERISTTVSNLYVRYGRNFVIIYRLVYGALFDVGDIINKGDRIGKLYTLPITGTLFSKDYWAVEVQGKVGDEIYSYPLIDFMDDASKAKLITLWDDISVQEADILRKWVTQDRMVMTGNAHRSNWEVKPAP